MRVRSWLAFLLIVCTSPATLVLSGCSEGDSGAAKPVGGDVPRVSAAEPAGARPSPGGEDEGRAEPIGGAEELGIEVVGVQLSAAGYMLDFRYRIADPPKALPMLDRAVKPVLVHQESGARFAVPAPPKVGPLRPSDIAPRTDRTYFMMFVNPGRYVKAGDRVTVAIGDHEITDLVVQ